MELQMEMLRLQNILTCYLIRQKIIWVLGCLLYTSDAADEGLGVDLGGRRIIKK